MSRPGLKFLIVFYLLLFACNKDNKTGTTITVINPYSFKCWNTKAGAITNFVSNNAKFNEFWDFGDGSTLSLTHGSGTGSSNGPIDHVYKAPGIYTVTMIVNNDSVHMVKQQDTIQPNFWFYTSGLPISGDTIFFHFHAYLPPAGVSYLWTFGDGTSSTDSIPYHVFPGDGSFTVKLTINANPLDPDVWQVITIYKDPVYTSQMSNTRLWHGMKHDYYVYDSADHNVYTPLPDSSFAITYIDKLTLSYNYTTFSYNPSLSATNTIVFSQNSGNPDKPSVIVYNYATDSISIFTLREGQGGPGQPTQAEEITWRSP